MFNQIQMMKNKKEHKNANIENPITSKTIPIVPYINLSCRKIALGRLVNPRPQMSEG